MKRIILVVMFSVLIINAKIPSLDQLEKIEKDLSCTKQYDKDGNNSKLQKCIKKMIEIKINENIIREKDKVQLGVFSKEEDAKKKIKEYNKKKEKINNIKTSKADYTLKKFKGHKKLKNGEYYVVFVTQEDVSAKELQRKIKGAFFKSIVSDKAKIIIDIDNKIVKNMPDNRVKILKEKANCYTKYQENKELNQFMKCLKKEVITGMQIYALFSKETCEKIAKNYKNAQCIHTNKIKNEIYHTVVITVESSNIKEKNKIKKKILDAFPLKKPEILIK